MKLINITIISLIFLLGFLSATIFNYNFNVLENPFSINPRLNNGDAPFDFIKEEQIKIYDDRIVIYIEDVSLSRYASTGSMKPVLDKGANGIRIQPDSEEDIHVGDIITFEKNNMLIVHRVIEKGTDNNGIYFISQGDNNSINDGKIRFRDIKYITVGVIW